MNGRHWHLWRMIGQTGKESAEPLQLVVRRHANPGLASQVTFLLTVIACKNGDGCPRLQQQATAGEVSRRRPIAISVKYGKS